MLITYTLFWNIRSLDFNKYEPYFSRDLNWIGKSIRLDQYWALFAPKPMQDGGWFILVGRTKDTLEKVDVKTGKKPDFSRPERTATTYKDFRWKKYLLNIWLKKNSKYRKHYANYLCRISKQKLWSVEIIYMLEKVLLPNSKNSINKEKERLRKKPKKITLWKQECP